MYDNDWCTNNNEHSVLRVYEVNPWNLVPEFIVSPRQYLFPLHQRAAVKYWQSYGEDGMSICTRKKSEG